MIVTYPSVCYLYLLIEFIYLFCYSKFERYFFAYMSADRDKDAMIVKQNTFDGNESLMKTITVFIRQSLENTVNQVPNSAASSLKS